MKMRAWGKTDIGLKRSINQDSILVDLKSYVVVVADGMGGHKGGEVASALAIETASEVLSRQQVTEKNAAQVIEEIFNQATRRIFHKSSVENPDLMGMGTTMVMALFVDPFVFIGNVGDSRAYLYSQDQLWMMTEDHSLIVEQLKAGVIREEDIDSVTGKNVITRSVGFENRVEVDIIRREMQSGDTILLCSDGLSGLASHQGIQSILEKESGNEAIDALIAEAKRQGGDDNISAIIMQCV